MRRSGARDIAPFRVAFRVDEHVGTRAEILFAARWLAYAFPYRRFACFLADVGARLGADVGRYSFIAVDFHHRLLAGLTGAPSMYLTFDWSVMAPGHHGYQRACELISGQAPDGGHQGHQSSRAPGRPNLDLVLSSCVPRRVSSSTTRV